MKMKIDLVYLYVDGNDENFQKEKLFWEEKLNISNSRDNNGTRYIDNEELRYSLRSVKKYAPWINNIYIITNGQIPKWFNIKKSGKIKFINHSDFIPKQYLPTFNSRVIESYIANIPELSEYFLYANDDMLMNKPIRPEFFFNENNKPIVRLIKRDVIHRKVNNTGYNRAILHSINLINKKYGTIYNFKPHHNIDSYTKTSFLECIDAFKDEFEKLRKQKFRQKSIQRIIFSLYMLENNQAELEVISPKDKYIHENSLCKNIMPVEKMQERILKNTPQLICFNDEDTVDEKDRKNLMYFYEILYPKVQKWEKYPNLKIDKNLLAKYKKTYFRAKLKYNKIFSIQEEKKNNTTRKVVKFLGLKFKFKIKEKNNA